MTIDEAILRLENTFTSDEVIISKQDDQAVKLGIEALERIKECRLADHTIKEDYLPGETQQ